MGLFGKSDKEKEQEASKAYNEAQRRLQEAQRKREREKQVASGAPAARAATGTAATTTPPRAQPAPAAAERTYTVKSGDSLSKISKQELGDGKRWREIYDANREVIGDNPDLIKPGQKLRLPSSTT
jgi:nucleoid-associated protein YgaU